MTTRNSDTLRTLYEAESDIDLKRRLRETLVRALCLEADDAYVAEGHALRETQVRVKVPGTDDPDMKKSVMVIIGHQEESATTDSFALVPIYAIVTGDPDFPLRTSGICDGRGHVFI